MKREAERRAAEDLDRGRQRRGPSGRSAAREWVRLRERFEALAKAAIAASHRRKDPGTRVYAERPDDDDAGAKWVIRSNDPDCQRDAELLCGLGGARLLTTGFEGTLPVNVRSVEEDAQRWLFFLKELGEARLPDLRSRVSRTTLEGTLYVLSYDCIDDLAKASQRGCLDCERRTANLSR